MTVGSASKTITYPTDASGNVKAGTPLSYYNGKSYTFTWQKGTQLASATTGGVKTTCTYDMSGVRSSKKVGGTTYHFATLSGLVMRQTWDNQALDSQTLDFVYDDSNQPYILFS